MLFNPKTGEIYGAQGVGVMERKKNSYNCLPQLREALGRRPSDVEACYDDHIIQQRILLI